MQLSDKLKKQSIGWLLISSLIIILLLIPNINILLNLFTDTSENWQHIKKYLLMDYIKNSLILIISTGLLTALIGTLLAWLIAAYEFPGRAFLSWALLLPLAIPPYIGAYTYAGLFSYTGPFQVLLRKRFGLVVNQQYFDFMTMRGAIFIYTIFLFPYVYLLAKSFLAKQSASLVEISCLLGKSATSIFFKVILPVSRGIIVAGASLVMLEVLNDYGVVKYFGIPTFSTAIFKTWFGMGDLTSAVRLAAIAMGVIFILLYLEKLLRGGRQYSYSTSQIRPLKRKKLTGGSKYFATMFSFSIFGLGFIIPVGQLLYWSYLSDGSKWGNLLEYSTGSILTGLLAATLVIIAAIIVANTVRINSGILSNLFARITMLGYSIPGAVIAVGILVFLLQVDQFISWLMQPFAIEINMF